MTTYAPGGETRVDANSFDGAPTLLKLNDGGYIMMWYRNSGAWPPAADTGVYWQRFDGHGTPVGSRIFAAEGFNAVTQLSDGTLLTASLDYSQYQPRIMTQKFTLDGVALGDAVVTASKFAYSLVEPVLAALPDGGFVLSYTVFARSNDDYAAHVFASRFNAAGVQQGDAVLLSAAGLEDYNSHGTAITPLADGGYVVSWMRTDLYLYPHYDDVMIQRFDASGHKVNGEVQVNPERIYNYPTGASVAPLAGGGFVVSWYDDGNAALSYQRFAADGQRVGDLGEIFAYGAVGETAVTGLPDGGFVITWSGHAHKNGLVNNEIYLRQFDADGHAVNGEVLVNTTTDGEQRYPDVITLRDGDVVTAWQGAGVYDKIFSAQHTNHAPTADAANYSAAYGKAAVITAANLLQHAADIDGDALTIKSIRNGSHGVAELDSHGNVVFTPAIGFVGDATFKYTVTDGRGAEATNTVTVTVTGTGVPTYIYGGAEKKGAYFDVSWDSKGHSILGSAYDDYIVGSSGNDSLNGGAGNDSIVGGAGNDVINAGAGHYDDMSGGAGQDTYILNKADLQSGDVRYIWDFDGAGDGYHAGAGDIISFNGFSSAATLMAGAPSSDPDAHVYYVTDWGLSATLVIYYSGNGVLKAGDYGFH